MKAGQTLTPFGAGTVTRRLFEVIGPGFDASTDETDDRILWVRASSIGQITEYLADYGVKIQELEITVHPEDIDFELPQEVYELRGLLDRFALLDRAKQ